MRNSDYDFGFSRRGAPEEEKPVPPGYRRIRTIQEIGNLNQFNPDKMVNNEIRNGENGTLAKIPKNPDRIARKETDDGTWIQFIHDRVYDPEKNQNRIKKTTIGESVEALIRGMMLVTHRYYQFFDHDGQLIYRGEKPGAATAEPEDLEEIEYEPCPLQAPEKKEALPEPTGSEPHEKAQRMAQKPPKATAEPVWPFDERKMKNNEDAFDGSHLMVKIPEIPGRITRRNYPEGNTTAVELILERKYNPETRQTRKKRVSIGTDAAPAFPGMMYANENYYKYFDPQGNWIPPESETDPELTNALKKWNAAREEQRKAEEAAEQSREQKMEAAAQENRSTDETIKEKSETPEQESETSESIPEETAEKEPKQQPRDMRSIVLRHIKSPQQFDYLRMVFLDYNAAVTQQVKKRPYVPMTLYQVLRINQILSELQIIFAGTSMSPYLQLAEIPENAGEKYVPLTYGDMDMIMKPYYRAINAFLYRST